MVVAPDNVTVHGPRQTGVTGWKLRGLTRAAQAKVMSKGILNSNVKGKSNLHSETRVGKEVYGSGIDEQGSAHDAAPGSRVLSDRADTMKLYVERIRCGLSVFCECSKSRGSCP